MKIQKCLRKILILLVFLIAANGAKAQNNCSSAVALPNIDCTEYQFQNSQYYWISFTADTIAYYFSILHPTNTPSNVTDMYLYSDSCSDLKLIITQNTQQYDSIKFFVDSLTQGATYYICVKQDSLSNNYFRLCVGKMNHKSWVPNDCPPPVVCPGTVDLISNGTFDPSGAFSSDNPFQSQNTGSVCGWQRAWGDPQIYNAKPGFPTLPSGEYAAYLWSAIHSPSNPSVIGEGIYHYFNFGAPQPNEIYSLSFNYACNNSINLNVMLTNDIMYPYPLNNNPTYYYMHDFVNSTGTDMVLTQNDPLVNTNSLWKQKTICFGNLANTYNKICIYPTNPYSYVERALAIDKVSITKHSFHITTYPTTINCGETVNIETDICPAIGYDGTIWGFLWSDGQTTQNITVTPTVTTTYSVTATSCSGFAFTDEITITVNPFNIVPELQQDYVNNVCESENYEYPYSILNPVSGITYNWTINPPNSGYFNNDPAATTATGTSVTITWDPLEIPSLPSYASIIVTSVQNNNFGCTTSAVFKIFECCDPYPVDPPVGLIILNNTNAQTALSYNNYDGSTFLINGNFYINQDLDITNSTIVMGPEARIIVDPFYTFAATSSTIRAGCGYMWDGIYVTDSNANVVIRAYSTVQEALNAIVSENGGKFELKNSKFYNNYTSVLVKNNYWGPYLYPFTGYPHKGIIKGCLFSQNGSMLNPCLGQKPRYGVYCDNVDRLTIGDSIISSNTNTFRNLYCGVYSKNANLKLVNNNFRRIKPSLYCQMVYPEVFTTQYCETAIFSIYYNPDDLEHINGSSLIGGGNSTITRNTFDTCNMAVYTYKTSTKLTKNKIYNTGTGIKCRDVRNPSYITHSIFKTNTPIGIQVINTVPSFTKVTVMYDTILDPTYGIYLSNIKSHATIATLKSVVRNNYVTLNKTGVLYGIRLENSNYINVYCNKVKRSTLVPVADSLRKIGIQLEHCASAYIHDNSFSKLSLGIKCSGNLTNAKLKMNNIDSCYHGFYFATAYSGNTTVLTNQGAALWPFDNKFSEYPGKPIEYRYGGALPGSTSISWWYKYPPSYYRISIPLGHPLINRIVPQQTTGNDTAVNCGSQPQGLTGGGISGSSISNSSGTSTDAQALDIAFNQSYSFGEINEPMKYILQDNAYNILSNMEQQPTPANSALWQQYNTVYSQLTSGNIGKFSRVLSLVDAGQIADARSINAGITPTNDIESNKQFAYSVYFDYVIPQTEIPAAMVDKLQIVADTPPCIGGGGVYVARAILGYTETYISENKSLEQQSSEDNTEGTIVVYPNPTDNEVNILFDGYQSGQQIYAGLYSLVGTPVLEKQFACGQETLSINTGNLPAGCYIFVLKTKDKTIYNNRLVIIR